MTENTKNASKAAVVPGLGIFGCFATGLCALVSGVAASITGQAAGAGICFLAAFGAFGLIVYISFRD